MPRLPQQLQPGAAPVGRRAGAADFGALEAGALAERSQLVGQLGSAAAELEDARSRIRRAAGEAKVTRAAAEYSAARSRQVLDFEQDPDPVTREERFQKAGEDLLKQAQAGLPADLQGALAERVFSSDASARLQVARGANTRLIRDAQADTDEAVRVLSDEEAREVDPVRRAQIRGQRDGALDRAFALGVIDQAQLDERRQRAERAVGDADRLRAFASDPGGAYRALGDPASPLARGLGEKERLEARAAALRQFEHELSEERSALSFQQSQQDRAERDRGESAQRELFDALASGDGAAAQQILARSRNALSPDAYRWGLERIAAGGGLGDHKTAPSAYLDLSNAAAAGTPVREQADALVRAGQLTKEDRDRVVKASEDRRFGDVERFLGDATRQGLFDFDPQRQTKAAEIQRSFSDWRARNPEATSTQALEEGRRLLRAGGIADGARLLRPTDPGADSGTVNIPAAVADVIARAQQGLMSDEARDAELARLQALQRAQQQAGGPK